MQAPTTTSNPSPPAADQLLKELAEAGNIPVPQLPSEVSESTLAMRRRVIGQVANGWVSGKDGIRHLRYSHEDCIDMYLANPGISNRDLAMRYGVTEAWISIVINCDAFKVAMAARKEELVDPVLQATLNERFGALAARGLEVLMEKLAKPADQISDKLALEAASLGAKSVGLGQPKPAESPAADHLAAIAHRLIDLNRPAPQTLEGEVRRID